MTPFVVLTMARSGSHHLLFLLQAHPQVKMRKELLNKTFESLSDDALIAAAFRVPKRNPPILASGFKLLQEQLGPRPLTMQRLLNVPGIRFIVLERKDQLARLRFERQAHTVNNWGVRNPPEQPKPSVVLPPYHVDYWLRAARAYYRQLRELPDEQIHWVITEDMFANQDAVMTGVWNFLGVPNPGHLDVQSFQQEPRPTSATIDNIQELRDYFAGTYYEDMIP